jgi:hypothetical protein
MTEISLRYDIGNTFEDRDMYGPNATECRAPQPEQVECHAPASSAAARAPAVEPPTPGTAELVKAYAAPVWTTSQAAQSRDTAEPGDGTGQKACDLLASLVLPGPPGKALGVLGCAMLFDPAPDAAPPQVDNARGAVGTGGRDYAPPSGSGGASGK